MIKNTLLIKDKFIPLTLGITGIVLSVIWVLATTEVKTTQDIYMAIFTAITQGVLCSGAVYVNQINKTITKKGVIKFDYKKWDSRKPQLFKC